MSSLAAFSAVAALVLHAEVRREATSTFAVDEAFQRRGGVQLYFELVGADATGPQREALAPFLPLAGARRLEQLTEPVHVTVSRLSYELEKDVSFFTPERLLDVKYMQALAPELDVTARPGGGFRVGRAPSNTMTLAVHDDADFAQKVAPLARGARVVVQENTDFARVLGWRTAAWSTTWSFHEALAPGRTRVTVLTLNVLYNLPPPMLGGADRLFSDTRAQSLAVVEALRAYAAPP